MTRFLAMIFGKFIIWFMRLLKFNTTVFPGRVILKLFPNFLYKIKYPEVSIMVTGSSGKGSTTKVIANVLRDNNYTVTHNVGGSNLIDAFATTIIDNSNLKGEVKTDALVFEVDERYLKIITKYLKPKYLIINNITRDQPPRQGSFDIVFDEILKGIDSSMHLIVNGDDPITRKFSLYHKGKITYFGIDKTFMSTNKVINYTKDYLYCPKCKNKLTFDYYHYGSVGSYKCSNCDFKRDNIKYNVTNINKDNLTMTINNKYNIKLNNYLLFNVYNLCASFAVCDLIKINKDDIISSINKISIEEKIFNEFDINKRKYTVLNCKAENNATYNLSLLYTSINKEKKTIVLGLRQISRRYNHFDLSWLWDISFEVLNECNVDKVICAGPYRYDLATRIKYAGIKEENIIILEDLSNIKETIDTKTKGNVYGILNFDYIKPFIDGVKGGK